MAAAPIRIADFNGCLNHADPQVVLPAVADPGALHGLLHRVRQPGDRRQSIGGRGSEYALDRGLWSPFPKFVDVEDAENVYRIVSDVREKAMRKE